LCAFKRFCCLRL